MRPSCSRPLAVALVSLGFLCVPDIQAGEKPTARLVGGTWYRHLDTLRFCAGGVFSGWERGHDEPRRGTWRLRGRRLTLREGGRTHIHRILALTAADLHLTFSDGSVGLDYRRDWD